jgi:hypothetical protein
MPDGDKTQARSPEQAALPAVSPEKLVVCPECRSTFPALALETHLRKVHRIYLFRGARRSFNAHFAALLDAILASPPDPEAWQTLLAIAAEEQGTRADGFLTGILGQVLRRVPPERRSPVIDALGQLIGTTGPTGLAVTLASDGEILARQLALAMIANLPQPVDPVLLPPVRGLLLDRRLPVENQFGALANVLPSLGGDKALAEELLRTLVSGLGKAKSIERLRRFELRTGKNPLIDTLCEQLEDQLRMSCPRCSVELRRPEMIEHLWNEHQLILDGRRVREPWAMIEEWIAAYRADPDPELLQVCRTMAQRLDGEEGLQRVHRLIMQAGVDDPEAQRGLLQQAAEEHAACCPRCYALVPVPREVPPLFINHYRGRLSAGGYRVEVSDKGLRTSLEVATPTAVLYRGPEPDQYWTVRGVMILVVGPLVLLALAWSFGLVPTDDPPARPVIVILLSALWIYLLIRWWWRPSQSLASRAHRYAWKWLAPRLFADGFRLTDSAFLAGLAQVSVHDHLADLREAFLPALLKRTENAVMRGGGGASHLAALYRLSVEDAVQRGEDPVPSVVGQIARCFEGKLPLLFAEHLLSGWDSEWWTAGHLARLRVLLCDRAFEAGFEVRNLLDAGQTAPALGAVLNTPNRSGLAALRLLWSLRPSRPWDRCGESLNVFDLASDRERERLLGRHPDLLLWQEDETWYLATDPAGEPQPTRVLLGLRGLILQDVLFNQAPRVVEVNTKGRLHELVLGEQRFWSRDDLDDLALRMERWFRYAFGDFLSSLAVVENWQSPDRIAILRAWGAVPCPECQQYLLPRAGQVGIPLEEEASA